MTNQEYLAAVAGALGPLVAEVVFTGGLVVQEYWTIPTLREPRATVDADVIVEAATYQEYAAFGKRLRERGFLQLAEDATPPYRWIKDDLILDVIPLDVRVLGFTNRWYRSGVTNAACAAWLRTDPRVTISRDTHYQLANRLAFTWKLASLGISVVLLEIAVDAHHRSRLRAQMESRERFGGVTTTSVPSMTLPSTRSSVDVEESLGADSEVRSSASPSRSGSRTRTMWALLRTNGPPLLPVTASGTKLRSSLRRLITSSASWVCCGDSGTYKDPLMSAPVVTRMSTRIGLVGI